MKRKSSKKLTDKPERVELSYSFVSKSTAALPFEESGAWYWWDETQTRKYGPFRNQLVAEIALARYSREL